MVIFTQPIKRLKILILTNQVPFIRGGAEAHARGLELALINMGHEVEQIKFPFKFYPSSFIRLQMQSIQNMDFSEFNGHKVDLVISLLFPGYGVKHPNHVTWIIHQHRSVYDLFDESLADAELKALKQEVTEFDITCLNQKVAVYANSQNVANRLMHFNGINASVLYHPPPGDQYFYCAESVLPFVYFPSRVETLKRQLLLIQAASLMRSDLKILLSGSGSKVHDVKLEIERLNLQHRVEFLGDVTEVQKRALYAMCQAVFFGPLDEDLGYVTMEAMLSSKPVLTCSDSGGPLEFITNGQTGWVVDPHPQAIASKLDEIANEPEVSRTIGRAARAKYEAMGISWRRVVDVLLSAASGDLHP